VDKFSLTQHYIIEAANNKQMI